MFTLTLIRPVVPLDRQDLNGELRHSNKQDLPQVHRLAQGPTIGVIIDWPTSTLHHNHQTHSSIVMLSADHRHLLHANQVQDKNSR